MSRIHPDSIEHSRSLPDFSRSSSTKSTFFTHQSTTLLSIIQTQTCEIQVADVLWYLFHVLYHIQDWLWSFLRWPEIQFCLVIVAVHISCVCFLYLVCCYVYVCCVWLSYMLFFLCIRHVCFSCASSIHFLLCSHCPSLLSYLLPL